MWTETLSVYRLARRFVWDDGMSYSALFMSYSAIYSDWILWYNDNV